MTHTRRADVSRKISRRPLAGVGVALSLAALNAFAAPATGIPADSAVVPAAAEATAPAPTTQSHETQIAEFRYGAPKMGSTPRLPIPPPHRIRSGSGDIQANPNRLTLARVMQPTVRIQD